MSKVLMSALPSSYWRMMTGVVTLKISPVQGLHTYQRPLCRLPSPQQFLRQSKQMSKKGVLDKL
jgi:hypothetical protein